MLEREVVCKDSGDHFQETWEFGANRDLFLPAAVQGTKQESPLPFITPLAASPSRQSPFSRDSHLPGS